MENKQKTWKLVLQDYHNDDQYLLGFYPSETDAKLAIPFVKQRYKEWIGNREPIIKRVNPEMILNPVCTDYMHKVDGWCMDNLKEKDLVYYMQTTD